VVEQPARLGVGLPVGDHRGVGHLRLRVREARLDLLDERSITRPSLGHHFEPGVAGAGPRREDASSAAIGDGELRVVGLARGQLLQLHAGHMMRGPSARAVRRRLDELERQPAISGTPTIRRRQQHVPGGQADGAKTKMATIITTSRKLVPQRGCRREKRCAFSA
jgi:hypothetical protein